MQDKRKIKSFRTSLQFLKKKKKSNKNWKNPTSRLGEGSCHISMCFLIYTCKAVLINCAAEWGQGNWSQMTWRRPMYSMPSLLQSLSVKLAFRNPSPGNPRESVEQGGLTLGRGLPGWGLLKQTACLFK